MSLLWKPSRLTNPLLVDVSFVESCGHSAHASRPRLHFRTEVGVSSIKPIYIKRWRVSASDSTAHIRMETLRGNRGLGSGCHGALKNVSKGAVLVFYYGVQMLRGSVSFTTWREFRPLNHWRSVSSADTRRNGYWATCKLRTAKIQMYISLTLSIYLHYRSKVWCQPNSFQLCLHNWIRVF